MYFFCCALISALVSLSSQFGAWGALTILLVVPLMSLDKVMVWPLSLTTCCCARAGDGDDLGAANGLGRWPLPLPLAMKWIDGDG